MGGPNLEVFKFGFYMFFPIYAMFKFGDPEWYDNYVQPYKDVLYPPYESTNKAPRNPTELKEAVEKIRSDIREKAARRKQLGVSDQIEVNSGEASNTVGSGAGVGAVQREMDRAGAGAGAGWVGSTIKSGERLV
ncbi:hypothetical protein BCR39DRAFT_531255 [Naematelia encephala]|uniref:Protein PET100, mitochondrial n=1 Tax=Naematelia encephala TaxID=71784 RepID=A0A1Y2B4H8_9TREE|nr:hypothetical protein BCR39DRAFT_531255 [Naematelia encephala]